MGPFFIITPKLYTRLDPAVPLPAGLPRPPRPRQRAALEGGRQRVPMRRQQSRRDSRAERTCAGEVGRRQLTTRACTQRHRVADVYMPFWKLFFALSCILIIAPVLDMVHNVLPEKYYKRIHRK